MMSPLMNWRLRPIQNVDWWRHLPGNDGERWLAPSMSSVIIPMIGTIEGRKGLYDS